MTIIIAGSDTVAPTLVFLFYELALNRAHQEKLREELNSVDVHDPIALRSLPHLNGVINESLRIHPPVPTGGYRQSPKGGMTIADTYIPGNVTIVAPRYTLGKLEACFEQAEEFIPERWYSRREMIKDERAFSPFAQGKWTPLPGARPPYDSTLQSFRPLTQSSLFLFQAATAAWARTSLSANCASSPRCW